MYDDAPLDWRKQSDCRIQTRLHRGIGVLIVYSIGRIGERFMHGPSDVMPSGFIYEDPR